MLVKDIMTTNVVTVKADVQISEGMKLLVDHSISGLIVVDDNEEVMGVVTEKDFLVAYDFIGSTDALIKEFLTCDVISVEEDESIEEVSRLLVKRNIKRVPIVKDRKVVGVVSRIDIIKNIIEKN